MKVLSQLLGRYSDRNKPLILFRLPETDTLFYRLSDIEPLFDLPPINFKGETYKNCYRDHEDTYLNTKVLEELSFKYGRPLLSDLCRLKPDDYNLGLADPVLQNFPKFKRAPKEDHIWESVQLPLENLEDVIKREKVGIEKTIIKAEPTSPPPISQVVETRNVMALDKVLLSSNELRKQSMSDLERPPTKRQRVSASNTSSPNREIAGPILDREKRILNNVPRSARRLQNSYPPLEKVDDKKRQSSKHKNSLNLTIFAPSYHEQLAGVRSAPINSNFNCSMQQPQPQQHRAQYGGTNQSHFNGSTLQTIAPASATIARPPPFAHQPSPRRHEFAIPPIVPSQQQPPHSAHPTSRETISYQQYVASPSLYGNGHPTHAKLHPPPPPPPSTATSSTYNFTSKASQQQTRSHENQQLAVNAASVPLPPKTPTTNSFAALQRQQYLQPFEHLFDTIETTRTLKTTLDDQIRRSSSLMQTLQASVTTIEGLVRNQVKEVQWELMSQIERTMDGLVRRLEVLEHRLDRPNINGHSKKQTKPMMTDSPVTTTTSAPANHSLPSPLPSATREDRSAAEDLVAFSERRRENNISDQPLPEELQTPPTIVRSQNDIGPQEYHTMLNTLRERLDRLERQIET
ncbi:hypothetical protein EDC96DRAFT_521163 [Choanephora cucurbitarum]|nr:hypothetical protein EDC96DRAFT_521163 [Choanephora cucurbitarum]